MSRTKNNLGFTLVEVLIVAIIIAFVTLASMAFFATLNKQIKPVMAKYYAITITTSQVEDLREIARTNFDDSKLSSAPGQNPHSPTITIPAGFTITYTIDDNYDWPEDGTQPPTPPGSVDNTVDYKKVVVTCVYSTNKQVQFKTYLIKR